MNNLHTYKATLTWTGNLGSGTKNYGAYSRNHTISIETKPDILLSSDPSFRGDATRYNPEELLLISLSSCHLLWYLHLCANAGIVVMSYTDTATGAMIETPDGGGKFSEVVLNPIVTVQHKAMIEKAKELHREANKMCYIANSCNFPVRHTIAVS